MKTRFEAQKTETAIEAIPTTDLHAVTGGTTGIEPGSPDPGNDPKRVCLRLLGGKVCFNLPNE